MDAICAARRLAFGQGAFLVAYGLWPILHPRSFEAVTGPKEEGWPAKAVGALMVVAGTVLLMAASSARAVDPEEARAAVG